MSQLNNTHLAEMQEEFSTHSMLNAVRDFVKTADLSSPIDTLQQELVSQYPELNIVQSKKPELLARHVTRAVEAIQQKEIRVLQAKYRSILKQIAQEDIFTSGDLHDFEASVDDSVVYNASWYSDHSSRVQYLQTSINEYLPSNRIKLKYYDDVCSRRLTAAKQGNWASEKNLKQWHAYIYGQQHAWYKKIEIIKTEFLPQIDAWEHIGTMRNDALEAWKKSDVQAKEHAAYNAINNKEFFDQNEGSQQKLIASAVAALKSIETNTPEALKTAENIIANYVEKKVVSKAIAATTLKKIFRKDASANTITEAVFGSKEGSLQALSKEWQLARAQFDAVEAKRAKSKEANFNFVTVDTFINWSNKAKQLYIRAATLSLEKPSLEPQLELAERQLSVHQWAAALQILGTIRSGNVPASTKTRITAMQQYAQSQLAMEIDTSTEQAEHAANTTEEFEFAQVCAVVRQVSQPLADLYESAAKKNSLLLQTVMTLIVNGIHIKPVQSKLTTNNAPQSIRTISEDTAEDALEMLEEKVNTDNTTPEHFILGADGSGMGAILSSCSSNVNNARFQNSASIVINGTDKATIKGVAQRYHSRLLAA